MDLRTRYNSPFFEGVATQIGKIGSILPVSRLGHISYLHEISIGCDSPGVNGRRALLDDALG
jgi:hypothetical protein